ncbi:unnamed protein product [Phytomonas sp. Hart1]|nr:unnamed protein product [Phytomonas sp. Hart1]|eukprot:CCW71330.1 unnamed protein product [Phytomonas sp. isolate Hart1]
MSKAAYVMHDHIRRSYSYITDLHAPNTFLCRGRLSFPQGLTAIALWFYQKTPADLYAHAYFVERQANPGQPSPQMHTTEEVQGVLKVMQGLRHMRDDLTKLDNTMAVVTDFLVPAKATMLVFDPREANAGPPPPSPDLAPPPEDDAREGPNPFADGSSLYSSHFSSTRTMEKIHEAPAKPSRVHFPGATEAVANAAATQAYFRDVLQAYKKERIDAMPDGNLMMKENNAEAEEGPRRLRNAVVGYREREGGHTILYNPCELNERTFAELILRLEREKRVVKTIVVPTRQTWRDLQVWADAFPDAAILASGGIPIAPAAEGEEGRPRSGNIPPSPRYRDVGNGVMGIIFPEVDLEAEEREREADERTKGPGAAFPADQPGFPGFLHGEDPADVLWDPDASHLFSTVGGSPVPRYGLRAEDAKRVRDLSKEGMPPSLSLTPRIELLHVPGDAYTGEYVLYDHHSRHLACVELFHGGYSDFDALNTWLVRVWFKFMRRGSHKRIDLVPRFKWRQVGLQGTLGVLQGWLDELTRRRGIHGIAYAHGTPPLVDEAANRLREQWNLPPLTTEELRRAEEAGAPHSNPDANTQQ